jgi:hypothetical protein
MIGKLWVLFVYFLLPSILLVFIWRDIRKCRASPGSYSPAMLASAVLLSVNVLLMSAFFISSVFADYTGSSIREHLVNLQGHWGSYLGLASSAVATIMASESKRSLARKLCIWSGAGMLVFWLLMLVTTGEQLEIYRIHHH